MEDIMLDMSILNLNIYLFMRRLNNFSPIPNTSPELSRRPRGSWRRIPRRDWGCRRTPPSGRSRGRWASRWRWWCPWWPSTAPPRSASRPSRPPPGGRSPACTPCSCTASRSQSGWGSVSWRRPWGTRSPWRRARTAAVWCTPAWTGHWGSPTWACSRPSWRGSPWHKSGSCSRCPRCRGSGGCAGRRCPTEGLNEMRWLLVRPV